MHIGSYKKVLFVNIKVNDLIQRSPVPLKTKTKLVIEYNWMEISQRYGCYSLCLFFMCGVHFMCDSKHF
jgi:hypothetical protein